MFTLLLWKFEIAFHLEHGVEGLIMVGILGKYGFKPSSLQTFTNLHE